MLGSLSFTGLPQASSLNNTMPNLDAAERLAKELALKNGYTAGLNMPLISMASGLLNNQPEAQQMQMPSPQIRQGGDYANMYQQYLQTFGLL